MLLPTETSDVYYHFSERQSRPARIHFPVSLAAKQSRVIKSQVLATYSCVIVSAFLPLLRSVGTKQKKMTLEAPGDTLGRCPKESQTKH